MINMDLESTIVTINNLLKLDFESSFSDFIQPQKQLMAIPDYQREYKWEKSKIKTFVALLYTYSIVSCHFISKCFWNCYKIYAGNFR